MGDDPIPLRCPDCNRPHGRHRPECPALADLERWFMEAAGLQVPRPGGLKAWMRAIRKDEE